MKRNYVEEIINRKNRLGYESNVLSNVLGRIHDISVLADFIYAAISGHVSVSDDYSIDSLTIPSIHHEASKYIPIALVSCIETYFKDVYARLIDGNTDFKHNASKFDINFNLKDISALEKNNLSVGEFVSHRLSVNNLQDINDKMNTIMDDDYFENLKIYRANEEDKQSTLLPMTKKEKDTVLFESINEVFHYRHQHCHESVVVTIDHLHKILNGAKHVAEFIWITEQLVARRLG